MILSADICLQRFLFSAGRCCFGRVVLKMKGEDMHFLQQKMNDLLTTEQSTYKELRSMYLTLLLDQFFIMIIGMVSTALVSSVGEAAIAAVSMVGTVNGMVSLVFTSMATGGAIVVARAKGRNDYSEIRKAIGEVTGICGVVAVVLSLVLIAASEWIVRALYPNVEPILVEYAVTYMRMMAVSFIPFSVFNAIFNILRSLGSIRQSLILTVVINLIHMLLSLLFINGMHMGVEGSGLSYILARAIGMVAALLMVLRFNNDYGLHFRDFIRFSPSTTREIFSLGMPLAVESVLLQGGMLLVQIYLARLTTTELAAHAVANSILGVLVVPCTSVVTLSGTVCGQCYGAGKWKLTRRYSINMIRIGRVITLISVLIFYPLLPLLLQFYHASPEGTPIIMTVLRIAMVCLPILWCDSSLPAMTLRVAGDSIYTGIVSVAALALARCVLGYLLTITFHMGVPGVWVAMCVEWLGRAVALRMRMRGTTWLHVGKQKKEA